jgi:ADP-ribose pyrophosphatase YjhB (NUDIX family)
VRVSDFTMAAGVVVFDSDGRVLFVKQNYGRRRYALPGGMVEDGESPLDTAAREAMEETGLVVEISHLIAMYDVLLETGARHVNFSFAADVVSGVPEVQDPAEISEVAWFDPDELPEDITGHALASMNDWRGGRRGVAERYRRDPDGRWVKLDV